MKTFRSCRWASVVAATFLLGILFVAVNPVSDAQGAQKESGQSAAAGAAGTVSEDHQGGRQRVGDPQGPPSNTGPGCYQKISGKSDKTIYKYFKNGHPDNPSDWIWVADDCGDYGK